MMNLINFFIILYKSVLQSLFPMLISSLKVSIKRCCLIESSHLSWKA